jgi:peptide deformylase
MAELHLPGVGCAPITLWGNPILRRPATPVTLFDAKVKRLVDQLFETMYAIETGVGLAANQIGRPESVFVFDCRDGLVAHVVNPVVEVIGADVQDGTEGCLSLPGIEFPTVRFQRCRVRGQDLRGDDVVYEADGLRSRCFQHETDHLNGHVYIDHLKRRTRTRAEAFMRATPWFGNDAVDPASDLYRRAQGFD